jgi:hypothetical protein
MPLRSNLTSRGAIKAPRLAPEKLEGRDMGSGAEESGAGDTGSESLAEPGTGNQQQAGNGETEAQAGEYGADLVASD